MLPFLLCEKVPWEIFWNVRAAWLVSASEGEGITPDYLLLEC